MVLGAGMLVCFLPEIGTAATASSPTGLAPTSIQILLFILGFTLMGLPYFHLSEKPNIPSPNTVFVGGIILFLVGVMDPATIKSLKLPGGGEFERHTPSAEEKKLTEALFRQDEVPWERLSNDENYKQLLNEAKKRTNAQRSASDYFILSTESKKIKEYDVALKFAHWGLIVEPKDKRIQAALTTRIASIYHELKLIEFANKHYLDAIGIDPYFAPPHNGLGVMHDEQGNHTDAKKEYREAIWLDPNFAFPHSNLGYNFASQGKYAEAEKEFNLAIQLDPKDALPHNGLGNAYFSQGKYAEAEKEFNLAIQLDPKDAYPHNGLGALYHEQGDKAQDKETKRKFYAKAKAKYSDALKINPDFERARENLEILQGLTGP